MNTAFLTTLTTVLTVSTVSVCVTAAFLYLIDFLYNRSSKTTPAIALLFAAAALKSVTGGLDMSLTLSGNAAYIADNILLSVIFIIIQFIVRFEPGNPSRLILRGFPVRNHAFLLDVVYVLLNIVLERSAAVPVLCLYSLLFAARGAASMTLRFMRKKGETLAVGLGLSFLIAGLTLSELLKISDTTSGYARIVYFSFITVYAFVRLFVTARKTGLFRQREKLLSDKVQAAENAFMNAQMKPHFIYNALNTIADRCTTDPEDAERLILSLSKYMRQTLSYDSLSGITPLKKELELVKAYADIECGRFDNIDVYYILPDELPDISLPPLTIQPLVENSIKHGLRGKHSGGWVAVSLIKKKDDLYIVSVEDNGIGMSDEAKAAMLNLPSGSDSIGLYNINQRLITLYGTGLNIEKTEEGGTRVHFELPAFD